MNKLVIVVISMFFVVACSSRYASNGEQLYLQSQNGAVIKVPAPLSDDNVSHFYDLPQQTQDTVVSIAPPDEPLIAQPAI